MSGFDVLEKWYADPELKKVPVIVLSNLGQEEDIQKTKKLGAKDYFIKSDMNLVDMIEKIKKYMVIY